jgi:hypothetical protein
MKSGTTSLCKYLAAHPNVYFSAIKEPGFFVEERAWNNGWDWYDSLFAESSSASAIGEGSTHYAKYPVYDHVAEKIAHYLPNVKFIYLMREPIARAVSHYWHMFHYWHEARPMLRALKQDPQYLAYSRYAMQLEQYFRHFSRDRFYLTSFERLKRSPRDVIRECFRFLGVDDEFVPEGIGRIHNQGPLEIRKTRGLIHRLRWSPWWTRVAPFVPQGVREFGKRLEFTKVERPRDVPAKVVAYLQPIFAEENERLFEMIGMRFDDWAASEQQPVKNGRAH